MRDVVINKIIKELIISNEDFEKYFDKKEWITKEDYQKYLEIKLDNRK